MSSEASEPQDSLRLPTAELDRLEAMFGRRVVATPDGGRISMREGGKGCPVVCLHGIGSGSASWLDTAIRLAPDARLLAWDAPGYGASTPLVKSLPKPRHYATRLLSWLDAMKIDRCVLVGHSLGAIMAAAAASIDPKRFASLTLISPARGYGAAGREAQSKRVRDGRLDALDELGIEGMAQQRSGRLLSASASQLARQWVYWNMAQLHEGGYRQAIELLCGADLMAFLHATPMPLRIACGAADEVTPPPGCADIARQCGLSLELIADAGHASYVEKPDAVAALLREVVADAAITG
ncbi:MAG: alpha/beta hydrolase [Burkholderiaceae bacterium]